LLSQAQKKNDKVVYKKEKQPSYVKQLITARAIKTEQPEKAIKLLESVLKQGKRGANDAAKAEAYFLLGNIYEDINQSKLALQRYQQAAQLLQKLKQPELTALNQYRTGLLNLKLENFKVAQQNFDACLVNTKKFDLTLKCQEAIGDLAIQSGNLEKGLELYNQLLIPEKGRISLDSLTAARIEAKKSQVFLRQNNRAKAEESYLNSISNVNTKTQAVSKKDYEIIEQTNLALQVDNVDDDVKISLSESSLKVQQKKAFPNEILIKENLQLAELYTNRGAIEK